MQDLIKKPFIGRWRSFKSFQRSGRLEKHTANKYVELTINEKGELLFKDLINNNNKIIEPAKWSIDLDRYRHFLNISGKPAFEIITINHADLVLLDLERNQKLFFLKIDAWESVINRVF